MTCYLENQVSGPFLHSIIKLEMDFLPLDMAQLEFIKDTKIDKGFGTLLYTVYSNAMEVGVLKVIKQMFCYFEVFCAIVEYKLSQFIDYKGDVGLSAI